jgi:hypothetical protein
MALSATPHYKSFKPNATSGVGLIPALGAVEQPMRTDTFNSVLLSGHKANAAEVPFDPGARWSVTAQALWPGRRGFPVYATLNGAAFKSAIVARSRKFWLLVPLEISESAQVSLGASGAFSVAPNSSFKPDSHRRSLAPDESALTSASDTTPGGSA